MRNILLVFGWTLVLAMTAFAQNRGEIGAYGEYFRLQSVHRDLLGLGGRLAINVHPNIALEAELSYDFERGFTEGFTNGIPNSNQLAASNVRVLHGLFGPKLQFRGRSPVRVFATIKGGFLNLGFSNQSPGSGFSSQINNLRADKSNGALYPGGGIEAFVGPVGLRLDVGDEIFFNNGANHNFRLTFGPHIRF